MPLERLCRWPSPVFSCDPFLVRAVAKRAGSAGPGTASGSGCLAFHPEQQGRAAKPRGTALAPPPLWPEPKCPVCAVRQVGDRALGTCLGSCCLIRFRPECEEGSRRRFLLLNFAPKVLGQAPIPYQNQTSLLSIYSCVMARVWLELAKSCVVVQTSIQGLLGFEWPLKYTGIMSCRQKSSNCSFLLYSIGR